MRRAAILVLFLLLAVPFFPGSPPAEGLSSTTPFLLGTVYGDNHAKDFYSNGEVTFRTPLPTFQDGGMWVPVNTTIVPSANASYAWEVTRGKYAALWKANHAEADPVAIEVYDSTLTVDVNEVACLGAGKAKAKAAAKGVSFGSPALGRPNVINYPAALDVFNLSFRYEGDLLVKEITLPTAASVAAFCGQPSHIELGFTAFLGYVLGVNTTWQLTDTARLVRDGEILLEIQTPLVLDAAGELLHPDFTITNQPVQSRLKVTIDVDLAWLLDPARAYPVIVDPTLSIQPSQIDSYVDEGNPTSNFGTATLMDVQSFTVFDKRTFVKWDISGVPQGVPIVSALAELWMWDAPSFSRTHEMRRTTASWVEIDIDWNNQPAATATDQATTTTGTTNDVWLTWNITTIFNEWYDGNETNFGVRVGDSAEGNTVPRQGRFRSREYATASERPRLIVTYTDISLNIADPAFLAVTLVDNSTGHIIPPGDFFIHYTNATTTRRLHFSPFPVEPSQELSIYVNDTFGNNLCFFGGINIGVAGGYNILNCGFTYSEVHFKFSDGRDHLFTLREEGTMNIARGFGAGPHFLTTQFTYTMQVAEDEHVFGDADFTHSFAPDSPVEIVDVALAPKSLDELYANQAKETFVGTFDGAGDRIEIAHTDTLAVGSSFTIAAWVFVDASEAGSGGIFDAGGRQEASDEGFNLHRTGTGIWRVQFFSPAGTANQLDSQTTAFTDVWSHVTTTYDGADLRIYVNGTQDNSVAETDSVVSHATSTHYVGVLSDVGSYIDAEIANLQVYNNSLTANEVAELWSRGIQGAPIEGASLLLHLPLATQLDATHDYSGNDNHGTLIGDTTFLQIVTPRRATVHFVFFDAALGEPHDLQDWVLFWGNDRVADRTANGFVGASYNYTVKSGFGSDLASGSAVVDDYPNDFVDIILTSYAFTVFNQREACTLTQLTFDATGIGRTRFINQWQEFTWWVPGGDFTLNVTFYSDALCSTIDSYVEAAFTISAANNFILTSINTLARAIAVGTETDNKISVMWDDLNSTWAAVNATHASLLSAWSTINITDDNVRFAWDVGNNTWEAVNVSDGKVVGVWARANATFSDLLLVWDNVNASWSAVNVTSGQVLSTWTSTNRTYSRLALVWDDANSTFLVVDASSGNILGIYDITNRTFQRVNDLDVPAGLAIVYDTYYIPPTNMMDLLSKDRAPGLTIDPFRTLIYDVITTSEGTGRLALNKPFDTGWDEDDVTMMQDDLHVVVVSGSLTRWWLNDTKDTAATGDDTIVLNITYTGFFDLTQFGDGLNLSVETTGTASVNLTRVSQVRFVSTFLWTMDTVTRQFLMTTSLENTLSLSWSNVNLYIAFPQTADPDASTVVVRDVTASVNLEKGIHYDLTDGGVYLALTSLDSGAAKTWQISFFERVEGTSILEPRCSFGQITTQKRGLVDMHRVEVACVNENAFDYRGRIVLVFDPSREVRHDSIIVEDLNGNILSNTAYWNDRDTLILTGVGVDSLETLQLVVWFRYVSDTPAITDLLPWLPILDVVFAAFTIIAFVAWGRQPKGSSRQQRAQVATILFGILAVITFVLLIYLQINQGI